MNGLDIIESVEEYFEDTEKEVGGYFDRDNSTPSSTHADFRSGKTAAEMMKVYASQEKRFTIEARGDTYNFRINYDNKKAEINFKLMKGEEILESTALQGEKPESGQHQVQEIEEILTRCEEEYGQVKPKI